MKKVVIALSTAIAVAVSGCSIDTNIPEHAKTEKLTSPGENLRIKTPQSFVMIGSRDDGLLSKRVTINAPSISVKDAIASKIKHISIVPVDNGVNLKKKIAVYANNVTVKDYLRQLTGVSNYAYKLNDNVLKVSSVDHKRWNVAALTTSASAYTTVGQGVSGSAQSAASSTTTGTSSAGSTGQSGGGNTSVTVKSNDESWDSIIRYTERLMGVEDSKNNQSRVVQDSASTLHNVGNNFPGMPTANDNTSEFKPWVAGVRRLGIVEAAGSPLKIQILDDWFKSLIHSSKKQVNLDVKAINVTLDDSRGRGINWSALWGTAKNSISLSADFPTMLSGGAWSVGTNGSGSNYTVAGIIKFLSKQGKVSIITEPNVTTVNGSTAYISSGDEFSYLASVQQSISVDRIVTTTPTVATVKVGVSMAVTPRVLDDDTILIEIVPVISSLTGYNNITVADNQFKTPNIALQELATQVIAKSGQPIQLGGLITKKIAQEISRIPFKDDNGGVVNFLLGSKQNQLQRNELVITLTPTLVGA